MLFDPGAGAHAAASVPPRPVQPFAQFNDLIHAITPAAPVTYVRGTFAAGTDSTGAVTRNHVAAVDDHRRFPAAACGANLVGDSDRDLERRLCVTAVNAAPGSDQPANAGTIRRCAELEIGRNSVRP